MNQPQPSGDKWVSVRVPAVAFRALYPHAQRRGIEVGELLTELALSNHAGGTRFIGTPGHLPRGHFTMTTERLNQLRVMKAQGYSYGQIAGVLGCSRSTAQAYCERIERGEI